VRLMWTHVDRRDKNLIFLDVINGWPLKTIVNIILITSSLLVAAAIIILHDRAQNRSLSILITLLN